MKNYLAISQHLYCKGIRMSEINHITDFGDSISEKIVEAINSDEKRIEIFAQTKDGKQIEFSDIVVFKENRCPWGHELHLISENGDLDKIADNYDTSD